MGSKQKSSNMTLKTVKQAEAVVIPALGASLPGLEERTGKVVTEDSYSRIYSNFMRMERGSRMDDRTPLFKNMPRSSIIGGFDKVVKINAGALQIYPGYQEAFAEVEHGQRVNIGPMSMFVPASEDAKTKIGAVMSDKPLTSKVNYSAYLRALADVANMLPPKSIRAVTVEEALKGINGRPETALDPDTNSGWPYCMSRWYSRSWDKSDGSTYVQRMERKAMLDDIIHGAKNYVKLSKQGVPHDSMVDCFVALSFQRTVQKGPDQLKSPKSKRYVLAMPKQEVVAGKTIQIPLQQAIKQVRNKNGVYVFPAFHPKSVLDTHMQGFLSTSHEAKRTPLSGDISSFDATLPPQVMWDVANAMAKWMTKDTANLFLGLMYGDIYKTEVLSPIGVFEQGPSSVKSGSIFTSIGGCMWNYFLQRYGHHAGYYTIEQQCCMGDDFIIDGPGVSPETISVAFADFGMEAHPDKQFYVYDMVHFLQMTHVYSLPGGQGSVYRILGNSLSVEDDTQMRWDERNRYAYVVQALQRLNNAIFNPLAEQLIQYVRQGDSLQLGANLDPNVLIQKGGTYVERKLRDLKNQHWRQTVDLEFRDWAINRVLRGAKLAPVGVERYKQVYGIPFKLSMYRKVDQALA
nr:MAG: putative RNA-dependent RNA polymerase [Picobirnavirus sp.]